MSAPRRWRLDVCPLDRDLRRLGTGIVWRVHVFTPRFQVGVALAPRDRFVGDGTGRLRWLYVARAQR